MKIGFFCNEFPPRPHGGIGTFISEISRALVSAGHEVTVVQFGDRTETMDLNGVCLVTLREVRADGVAWLANRLRLLLWLQAVARREEIDVFEIPDFQGWLPFPVEPCPVVVRLHLAQTHIEHTMSGEAKRRLMYWLERQTLRWHPQWIGTSRYILEAERAFFDCEPKTQAVIYNPVPTTHGERRECCAPDGPFILFVGSVSERKGALLLAEAAAPLLEENPRLSLVYIGTETRYGDRPISEEIRHRVGARVAAQVVFTGYLPHDEVLAWMAKSSAVVLASRVESFGLVVVEAMRAGAPVVFSRNGPGPELVEHGVTGLLVDPVDVEQIRQALRRLLAEPSFARAIAERGRASVESRFRLDRCVAETLAFYERVLGWPRKRCGVVP